MIIHLNGSWYFTLYKFVIMECFMNTDTKAHHSQAVPMKKTLLLLPLLCWMLSACLPEPVQENRKHTSWMSYGGGIDHSKFVIQNQINKENASQLEVAWTYSVGDEHSYQNNPIIVDNVMYVFAKNNSLVALDATNGEEIWIHANLHGISKRGISYWESKDRSDRRIIFSINNCLQAIDAQTGKSILSFGEEGCVDLREDLGRDPSQVRRGFSRTPGQVFENLILMGSSPGESYLSPPGHIRAYNVINGELEWIFHTIPQPGEFGYDTWPKDAYQYVGGSNCWTEISIDEERGIAYVPLGSPTYDYYGADRHGANLFGNCLVALDARTGQRLWHFQTVHHDLWDYDLSSAPQLITVDHEGKQVDAVAIATKQGFLFVFNRETGEPLWPIEERPTPSSIMEGEQTWPTQPFPTVVPPFTRQAVSVDDISPLFLSKKEHQDWIERINQAPKGLFTPPSTIETIAMPGAVGGANCGNTASNPEEGIVYVVSQDYPSFYRLLERSPFGNQDEEVDLSPEAIQKGQIAFNKYCMACHGNDLAGTALGPSLLSMSDRLSQSFLRQTVLYGVGRMPPIQHIGEEEINHILAFLKENSDGSEASSEMEKTLPEGPVVASGGAPGEKTTRSQGETNFDGEVYPEGIEVPKQRYYTDYGLGNPFLLNPPWASITAYDLNQGSIKWTRPLGENEQALALGVHNTGVPSGSQRNGMIVTSNGLVFSTVANGKIYAYNADNGDILWEGETPNGIAALPAMYEVDGKLYLVVNASNPKRRGWNLSEKEKEAREEVAVEGSYVVFSLPNSN